MMDPPTRIHVLWDRSGMGLQPVAVLKAIVGTEPWVPKTELIAAKRKIARLEAERSNALDMAADATAAVARMEAELAAIRRAAGETGT